MQRIYGFLIALTMITSGLAVPVHAQTTQQTVEKGTTDATHAVKTTAEQAETKANAVAAEGERHGIPRWAWIVAAALLLVIVLAALSRRRRREAVIRTRIG